MKKIDFAANTEVKYLSNWKVVQTNMTRHKIDKIVPIDRLVKCKMQDNLEFLQWCKKYWDQYFPGGEYDAAGRRGGLVPSSSSNLSGSVSAAAPIRTTTTTSNVSRTSSSSAPPRRAGTSTLASRGAAAPSGSTISSRSTSSAQQQQQTVALQKEVEALNETVGGLEKERDFYFNKLRDIEILIQTAIEADPKAEEEEGSLIKQIQEVLYSTEEGFEVPQAESLGLEDDVEGLGMADDGLTDLTQNDDEVF